jgi:curved DNA-binding protein CbpA
MSDKDYYAILGILPSVDDEVIKAVYHCLIKKHHPDARNPKNNEADRIAYELNEAYSILGDKKKRANYDRARGDKNSGSGDFRRQSEADNAAQPDGEHFSEAWSVIIRYHPQAEAHRRELAVISQSLSLVFQAIIIDTRAFSQLTNIKNRILSEFMIRYFGRQEKVRAVALRAIRESRIDVAREINKAIKYTGDPGDEYLYSFFAAVEAATGYAIKEKISIQSENEWIRENFSLRGRDEAPEKIEFPEPKETHPLKRSVRLFLWITVISVIAGGMLELMGKN